MDYSLIVWLFVRKNFHWRLVGFFCSPVLCARRAGSIANFIVFQSRFTYVLDYILTSHYFLLLLKVIELDQRKHSKVVKCSVAIKGPLEKVVILMSVRQDALLALWWALLELPSQATNLTFLGSIKSHRKKGLGTIFSSQNPSPQKKKGEGRRLRCWTNAVGLNAVARCPQKDTRNILCQLRSGRYRLLSVFLGVCFFGKHFKCLQLNARVKRG